MAGDNNGNNDLFATDLSGTTRRITDCPVSLRGRTNTAELASLRSPQQLITCGQEFCFTPAWSPDGETIAFSIERETSKDSPAADHHVRRTIILYPWRKRCPASSLQQWSCEQVGVVPAAGGAARDITAELDRRVQYGGALPLAWSADVRGPSLGLCGCRQR